MMNRGHSNSTLAIWLASIGIGWLFLARGAFQPYIYPLFEHLGGLSYARIAILLNVYVLAQSVCAPIAGWFSDRTSVRTGLGVSIAMGLGGFLIISTGPGFVVSALAVFGAGMAFVLGKISLNTILILHSSPETLRRSVAKRATLLNLGSFFGNSISYQMSLRAGYSALAVLLGLLYLPLTLGLAAPRVPTPAKPADSRERGAFRALCRNRGFMADALRRFAMVLPYGCWGTVIPKYLIDLYGSNKPVWIVSLTCLCTTVIGAHFLAVYVSRLVYRRGFKWEWWSMCSVGFYCCGLLLLVFAWQPVMLPLAIVVFICGEVLMTPCFDETARKHSHDAGMSTCLGLLHLVDGMGRLLGAAFALAVYGHLRGTPLAAYYWPLVVGVFLCVNIGLHIVAHALARHSVPANCHPDPVAAGTDREPGL